MALTVTSAYGGIGKSYIPPVQFSVTIVTGIFTVYGQDVFFQTRVVPPARIVLGDRTNVSSRPINVAPTPPQRVRENIASRPINTIPTPPQR